MKRRTTIVLLAALLVAAMAEGTAPVGADGNESPTDAQTFRSITAGYDHTCGLLSNGRIRCWGYNQVGQLGTGDNISRGDDAGETGQHLPYVDLGANVEATSISAGDSHTCALLTTGDVKCWGANGLGQLGLEDQVSRGNSPSTVGSNLPPVDLGTGRTATAISAAANYSCALLDNGDVKCWGANGNGQLGLGDALTRGYTVDQMGDDLPPVDLGTERTATAISAGGNDTCAILDDGSVKCWGYNAYGQLGQGDTQQRGDELGEMGDDLLPIDLGTGRTATAISAANGACVILDNSQLKCWGDNSTGALGLGDTNHRGDNAGEMGDDLPAVDLGAGRTAIGISTVGGDACALLDDGHVKCWGSNTFGQHGQGNTLAHGDGPGEMGDNLPNVPFGDGDTATAITTGNAYACARTTSSQVKCWGINTWGQLGVGDTAARGDNPLEMGHFLPSAVTLDPQVRPDGQIRRGAAAFVGNNRYNTTGVGQTRAAVVGNRGSVTFTARIGNDGNVTDSLRLTGQPGTNRFTVTYKRGAANITAQVVAGTYSLTDLAPAATRDITIIVRAKAGTPVNASVTRTLTVRSRTAPLTRDTVKVTVTRH